MGIAVVAGATIGLVGGWLFRSAVKKGWTSKTAQQFGNLALALAAFWGSLSLGGNGFISAFVAGLVFGYATRNTMHEATEFTETSGTLLSMFVWALFGANLIIPLLLDFNLPAFMFALLSLTVVRMAAVAIALIGAHMRVDTVLMMGWLGPRGLASVVFMLIANEALHEAGMETSALRDMATWTILLSVVLHALSAVPLANWYARRLTTASPRAAELIDVAELPARRRRLLGHLSIGPGEQ
jgi:NhaP-type Na+/H+ or K+/H+ antiporter